MPPRARRQAAGQRPRRAGARRGALAPSVRKALRAEARRLAGVEGAVERVRLVGDFFAALDRETERVAAGRGRFRRTVRGGRHDAFVSADETPAEAVEPAVATRRARCIVDGCRRLAVARRLCRMHYARARRGSPLKDARPPVGSPSGHGRYGILELRPDAAMCHECGAWFLRLGTHVRRRHGLDPATYRERHGLPRGLPLLATRELERSRAVGYAKVQTSAWAAFTAARDPLAELAARDAANIRRPAAAVVERTRQTARSRGDAQWLPRACAVCGLPLAPSDGDDGRTVCSSACRSASARRSRALALHTHPSRHEPM